MAKDDKGHGSEKRGGSQKKAQFPRKERIKLTRAEGVLRRRELQANPSKRTHFNPKTNAGIKKAEAAVKRKEENFRKGLRAWRAAGSP